MATRRQQAALILATILVAYSEGIFGFFHREVAIDGCGKILGKWQQKSSCDYLSNPVIFFIAVDIACTTIIIANNINVCFLKKSAINEAGTLTLGKSKNSCCEKTKTGVHYLVFSFAFLAASLASWSGLENQTIIKSNLAKSMLGLLSSVIGFFNFVFMNKDSYFLSDRKKVSFDRDVFFRASASKWALLLRSVFNLSVSSWAFAGSANYTLLFFLGKRYVSDHPWLGSGVFYSVLFSSAYYIWASQVMADCIGTLELDKKPRGSIQDPLNRGVVDVATVPDSNQSKCLGCSPLGILKILCLMLIFCLRALSNTSFLLENKLFDHSKEVMLLCLFVGTGSAWQYVKFLQQQLEKPEGSFSRGCVC